MILRMTAYKIQDWYHMAGVTRDGLKEGDIIIHQVPAALLQVNIKSVIPFQEILD